MVPCRAGLVLVRPAVADDVPAVEDLFGSAGASNGCWCQYWLLGSGYKGRRDENRTDLRRQIAHVGAGYDFPDDDPVVLSCFVVARRARGAGVPRGLVAAVPQEEPVEGTRRPLGRGRDPEPVPRRTARLPRRGVHRARPPRSLPRPDPQRRRLPELSRRPGDPRCGRRPWGEHHRPLPHDRTHQEHLWHVASHSSAAGGVQGATTPARAAGPAVARRVVTLRGAF